MSELTFEEFCAQPLLYAGGISGDYGAHRAYRNDELRIQKEVVTKRKRYGDMYSEWDKGETYYFLDGDPRTFNNGAELYVAWMEKICGVEEISDE